MDFQELIRIRRSIRAYRTAEVPDDVLHRVLDAGRVAPTACNLQPFQLLVVTDPEVRASLKAVYRRDWFWQAPVIIAGCVEPGKAWRRDCLRSVKMSYLNGSVNLSSPQRFVVQI